MYELESLCFYFVQSIEKSFNGTYRLGNKWPEAVPEPFLRRFFHEQRTIWIVPIHPKKSDFV
jgi:hypothetical protein